MGLQARESYKYLEEGFFGFYKNLGI